MTTNTTTGTTTTTTTTATEGCTATVHYRGTLNDGSEFDNSHTRGEPITFTVGAGQMIPGFNNAVTGMTTGETKTVTIPAAEAYGVVNPEAKTVIPRSNFPTEIELTDGMPVPLRTPQGRTVYGRITEQQDDAVTVDLNHPLAGQDLQFEIELVSVTSGATDTTTTDTTTTTT